MTSYLTFSSLLPARHLTFWIVHQKQTGGVLLFLSVFQVQNLSQKQPRKTALSLLRLVPSAIFDGIEMTARRI